MLTFRKHFKFFSQQQRIIGESSLVSQSYPRSGSVYSREMFLETNSFNQFVLFTVILFLMEKTLKLKSTTKNFYILNP